MRILTAVTLTALMTTTTFSSYNWWSTEQQLKREIARPPVAIVREDGKPDVAVTATPDQIKRWQEHNNLKNVPTQLCEKVIPGGVGCGLFS